MRGDCIACDALFVLSMLFSNSAISDFGSIDLT